MLWQILVQFLFRLAFGLSTAMALTSPRWVTAGFYRVHLWVGLGLNTFIAGIVYLLSDFPDRRTILMAAIAAASLSYMGAVIWLYERTTAGQIALVLVALANLLGAWLAMGDLSGPADPRWATMADILTGGLLLGATVTAMLLGHWYLNTPTMKLLPLQRLVILIAIAVVLRTGVAALGLNSTPSAAHAVASTRYALLALRWLAGLAGVLGLATMTWQTLKIPNTQSATGILYVAVIFSFLGELTSQLLSAPMPPLI